MSSDIVNRGYDDMEIVDFLSYKPVNSRNDFDVITNPPYKYALDFVTCIGNFDGICKGCYVFENSVFRRTFCAKKV